MDKIDEMTNLVSSNLHKFWEYGLITISGNPVTMGNILIAITLLVIGMKYFKNFSNLVRQYIKNKINTDKDAANALEKLILYSGFSLYVILVLEIANIPLSIFAFIGGALAIGIGLGAQNLIGNFICSLLVMIERPLKIGDVVEVEGVFGTVQSVGARCAIITTPTNVDVLVPNNKLIYNTVINWTLNDTTVEHQALLKISRKLYTKHEQVQELIATLKKTIDSMEFNIKNLETRVNLTKIDENTLSLMINCYFDVGQIQRVEILKNELNLALIKNLADETFSVEYLKFAEIKPA